MFKLLNVQAIKATPERPYHRLHYRPISVVHVAYKTFLQDITAENRQQSQKISVRSLQNSVFEIIHLIPISAKKHLRQI